MKRLISLYFFIVPNPEFKRDIYIVPEDNRTLPLCIDVGVVPSVATEYIITSKSSYLFAPGQFIRIIST